MVESSYDLEITEINEASSRVAVRVSTSSLSKEINRLLRKKAKTLRIKGFRRGKVPINLVNKRYQHSVRVELIDSYIQFVMGKAFKKEQLRGTIYTSPIAITSGYAENEPLNFHFTAEYFHDLKVANDEGIPIDRLAFEISEEEVDEVILTFQDSLAVIEPVEDREIVQAGDVITLGFHENGKVKEQQVDLGMKDFLPDLLDRIVGCSIGETKTVEVNFPEDHQMKSLAGTKQTITFTVKKIKQKRLPDVDDELAREIGEFDTLDALKENIRGQLRERRELKERFFAENQAFRFVLRKNEVVLPEGFIKQEAKKQAENELQKLQKEGTTDPLPSIEDLNKKHLGIVAEQIRVRIVQDALVKKYGIKVEDQEVDDRIKDIAQNSKYSLSLVRSAYNDKDRREALVMQMIQEKVSQHLYNGAVFIDVVGLDPAFKKNDSSENEEIEKIAEPTEENVATEIAKQTEVAEELTEEVMVAESTEEVAIEELNEEVTAEEEVAVEKEVTELAEEVVVTEKEVMITEEVAIEEEVTAEEEVAVEKEVTELAEEVAVTEKEVMVTEEE